MMNGGSSNPSLETLPENRELLRIFLEHAPAALAMFDAGMRYLAVSDRWRSDYGLGDRNLIGVSHYEVFPEMLPEWREVHRRGLAGEVVRSEGERFVRSDGSDRWLRWEVRPWYDAAGTIGGIIIFTEDFTAIKKAEAVLWRYELMAEQSLDIILMVRHSDGRILEANRRAVQAYGYSRDELLGMTVADLRSPETLATAGSEMGLAARRGILFETVHRRRDGSTFPVEVSSRGTETGGTGILVSIVRDISERKQAEEAKRESELRFRALFENSLDAVLLTIPDGTVLAANPAACLLFGRSEDELCALGRGGIVDPADPRLADLLAERERTGRARGELTFLRSDGTRFPGEVSSVVFTDLAGNPRTSMIIRDISARLRAEETLRLSEEKFSLAFTNNPAAIALTRLTDGLFLDVNATWEGLTGYRREEVLGVQGRNLPIWPTAGAAQRFVRELEEQGYLSNWEQEFRNRAGGTFVAQLSAQVLTLHGERLILSTLVDITGRKQAEAALQESEARFRALVETSYDWVWEVDADGRYTFVSHKVSELLGYAPEEVVGKTPFDLMPEEEAERVGRIFGEIAAEGRPFSCLENVNRHRDGRLVVLETSGVPFVGPDGKFAGYRGMDRNITERKKALDELVASEQRFSTFFSASPTPIAISRLDDGRFLDVNAAFLTLYGYTREEVIGHTSEELRLWYADNRDSVMELLRQHKKLKNLEVQVRLKGGDVRTLLANLELVELSGEPCVLAILVDITDKKQADTALRESEAKFRQLWQEFTALLDAIPDSIMLLDRELRVVWANRVTAEEAGAAPGQVAGRQCHALWHRREIPCDQCPVVSCFLTGASVEETVTNADGRTWDIRTVPLLEGGGAVSRVIVLRRDITEQKKLEQQYLHAQKMESVGTLAGGIAHDFNNILTVIVALGEVTLMKMAENDPHRPRIGHILEAADRATHLTRELLLFSRKQEAMRRPVDLNSVVGKLRGFLKRMITEDISLRFEPHGAPLPVLADKNQLEQVLMNLAVNARDAMPNGGEFVLRTEDALLDHEFTTVHGLAEAGPYALLTVSDTGAGMDRKTQERIFEPFFSTKEVGKGTGLGLSVVHGIITQHDGIVTVSSEPGQGSTFRIYLPLNSQETQQAPRTQQERQPPGGTETILLAEDDELVRMMMTDVLTEAGYRVITAVDGQDAVEKYRENRGSIHLLLFDLIMPRMNGKDAFEAIRKMQPQIRAIFASGYAPETLRQKASVGEGSTLIAKPVAPFDLLEKVRSVLDGAMERRDP